MSASAEHAIDFSDRIFVATVGVVFAFGVVVTFALGVSVGLFCVLVSAKAAPDKTKKVATATPKTLNFIGGLQRASELLVLDGPCYRLISEPSMNTGNN